MAEHIARNYSRLKFLARICAVLVAIEASLVFVGWSLEIEFLKSLLHPSRVAMNPATALAFLLLSASLWLQVPEPIARKAMLPARIAAAIVVFIALWRLAGYAFGWTGGVDQFMFRSRLAGNVMAPNTAGAFLLVATALLLLDARSRWKNLHAAPALVLIAGCVALFSITGYLYSDLALYQVRQHIPMALNTAINFALMCVGVIFARPQRQPIVIAASDTLGGTVARRLVPAALLVPLLLGWFRVYGQRHGYYESDVGTALLVLGNIIIFGLLVWWCADVLHKAELRQRRIEAELRQSEERHRAIMQQSAEGIYLVDLETRQILDSNAALDRLMGYSTGESKSLMLHELINDTVENVDERLKRVIEAGGPLHGERVYRRKDGSLIEVHSSASLISYGGRNVACTVVHDITERKRAERELHEKHIQLQQALEQLKLAQSQLVQTEKLASLGQMVAGVAHEINNPLSFVSNNVAVLERDAQALCDLIDLYNRCDPSIAAHCPEQSQQIVELSERIDLAYTKGNVKELASRSREGLRRIQQIVKDLRDFARLDQSDIHAADLNAGITSTINIISGLAKNKRIVIEQNLTPLPLLTCQPAKINQVVMNLLSNAIDASPEGARVVIRSEAVDNQIQIHVRDSGHGIDPKIRERIFDPFFTTKPPGAGTGLGLSISYGIIRDHGGRIEVESTPGAGSTFVIKLPIRQT